jgi:hypothetical protein
MAPRDLRKLFDVDRIEAANKQTVKKLSWSAADLLRYLQTIPLHFFQCLSLYLPDGTFAPMTEVSGITLVRTPGGDGTISAGVLHNAQVRLFTFGDDEVAEKVVNAWKSAFLAFREFQQEARKET